MVKGLYWAFVFASCTYVCMYVCVYVYVYVYVYVNEYIYIYMYVCMYIYIYIYMYCNWCGPLSKQNCKQSQNSESNPDTLINGNPCCMKVHLQSHAPVFVFSSTHKIVSQDEQQRFGKERPRSCKSKDPVSANTVAPQKWLQGSMIPTCPLPGFPEP